MFNLFSSKRTSLDSNLANQLEHLIEECLKHFMQADAISKQTIHQIDMYDFGSIEKDKQQFVERLPLLDQIDSETKLAIESILAALKLWPEGQPIFKEFLLALTFYVNLTRNIRTLFQIFSSPSHVVNASLVKIRDLFQENRSLGAQCDTHMSNAMSLLEKHPEIKLNLD